MALDTVAVRLHDGSGNTLGQGVGADADGHPLDAVARLARELAAMDRRLEAGGRLVGVFSADGSGSVEVAVRRL